MTEGDDKAGKAKKAVKRRQAKHQGGRTHSFRITVNDEQNERLLIRAGPLTRQNYLLAAGLSNDERTVPERRALMTELAALKRELGAIGNNVNQLARAAHTHGQIAAGTSEALASIARLEERLSDVIEGLR